MAKDQGVDWFPPVPWYHHVIAWVFPLVLVALCFIVPVLLGMRGHEAPHCSPCVETRIP